MEYVVSHIFKEGNQVTDKLVSHIVHSSQKSWWHSSPDFIASLVGWDMTLSLIIGFVSIYSFPLRIFSKIVFFFLEKDFDEAY